VGNTPPAKQPAYETPNMKEETIITFEPTNTAELSRFFKTNKNRYHEIWIVITKKKHLDPQLLSFTEAVAEAIKHNLIDSRTKSLNDEKYAIRFTKRNMKTTQKKRSN
jgi:hypothetical protein